MFRRADFIEYTFEQERLVRQTMNRGYFGAESTANKIFNVLDEIYCSAVARKFGLGIVKVANGGALRKKLARALSPSNYSDYQKANEEAKVKFRFLMVLALLDLLDKCVETLDVGYPMMDASKEISTQKTAPKEGTFIYPEVLFTNEADLAKKIKTLIGNIDRDIEACYQKNPITIKLDIQNPDVLMQKVAWLERIVLSGQKPVALYAFGLLIDLMERTTTLNLMPTVLQCWSKHKDTDDGRYYYFLSESCRKQANADLLKVEKGEKAILIFEKYLDATHMLGQMTNSLGSNTELAGSDKLIIESCHWRIKNLLKALDAAIKGKNWLNGKIKPWVAEACLALRLIESSKNNKRTSIWVFKKCEEALQKGVAGTDQMERDFCEEWLTKLEQMQFGLHVASVVTPLSIAGLAGNDESSHEKIYPEIRPGKKSLSANIQALSAYARILRAISVPQERVEPRTELRQLAQRLQPQQIELSPASVVAEVRTTEKEAKPVLQPLAPTTDPIYTTTDLSYLTLPLGIFPAVPAHALEAAQAKPAATPMAIQELESRPRR